MRLDSFTSDTFDRGASRTREALWIVLSGLLVESWLPGSIWRVRLLRSFGARIGQGVVIKPGVKVKFPWRLHVGSHCWIGEFTWIDNLVQVTLGDNVCISQGVYICTGSHDWSRDSFDLITQPVTISDCAWLAARSSLAPGTTVGEGAVLSFGCSARGQLAPWTIHATPAAVPLTARVHSGQEPTGRSSPPSTLHPGLMLPATPQDRHDRCQPVGSDAH